MSKTSFDDKTLTASYVIMSTGRLDRHGERINPNGWHLEDYSGKVLINHSNEVNDDPDAAMMNYVQCVNARVENEMLIGDFVFNSRYPKAVNLYKDFKEGFVNNVSVGFMVIKFGADGSLFDYDETSLLECSLVDIPANPDAGSVKQKGLTLDEVKEAVTAIINAKMEEMKKDLTPVTPPAEPEKKDEVVPNIEGKKDLINLYHAIKQTHTRSGRALKSLSDYLATKTLKLDSSGEGGGN